MVLHEVPLKYLDSLFCSISEASETKSFQSRKKKKTIAESQRLGVYISFLIAAPRKPHNRSSSIGIFKWSMTRFFNTLGMHFTWYIFWEVSFPPAYAGFYNARVFIHVRCCYNQVGEMNKFWAYHPARNHLFRSFLGNQNVHHLASAKMCWTRRSNRKWITRPWLVQYEEPPLSNSILNNSTDHFMVIHLKMRWNNISVVFFRDSAQETGNQGDITLSISFYL
jgi:hypothetical protein